MVWRVYHIDVRSSASLTYLYVWWLVVVACESENGASVANVLWWAASCM